MGDDLLFGEGMAYEWGTDWPEAFDVLSMSKQNRPLSRMLSPLGVMDELNKLYYMSRPRPGKPQGKPLPAPPHEGEMETESRKKAQKECQRMILPKGKKESPDLFLRRRRRHRGTLLVGVVAMPTHVRGRLGEVGLITIPVDGSRQHVVADPDHEIGLRDGPVLANDRDPCRLGLAVTGDRGCEGDEHLCDVVTGHDRFSGVGDASHGPTVHRRSRRNPGVVDSRSAG